MKIEVVKEFSFDAAHMLPKHPGQCQHLHGHTYRLQVGVKGDINPDSGMVADFGKLKNLVSHAIVSKLDHNYLNQVDVDDFPKNYPTAENMVSWIVEQLIWEIPSGLQLSLVRLYETPTSYAEWRVKEC